MVGSEKFTSITIETRMVSSIEKSILAEKLLKDIRVEKIDLFTGQ